MTRPHVFVVAGAGASKPFGFPLTSELNIPVLQSLTGLRTNDILWDGEAGYKVTAERRQILEEYVSEACGSGKKSNFERWYGCVESQYADLATRYERQAPEYADRFVVLSAMTHAILDPVLRVMDTQSQLYRSNYEGLVERQTKFFGRLKHMANVTVVTLNYDDVLFDTLGGSPSLMGFVQPAEALDAPSMFKPPRSFFDTQPVRLLPIHGHYRLQLDSGVAKLSPRNLPANWKTTHVGQYDQRTERMRPIFPIISGDNKPWALSGRPFISYYGAAATAAHRADALLVIGYGGGDAHVDELLNIAGEGKDTPWVEINPACSSMPMPSRFLKMNMGFDKMLASEQCTERVIAALISPKN